MEAIIFRFLDDDYQASFDVVNMLKAGTATLVEPDKPATRAACDEDYLFKLEERVSLYHAGSEAVLPGRYSGTVKGVRVEKDGTRNHLVHFDDGDRNWHNLSKSRLSCRVENANKHPIQTYLPLREYLQRVNKVSGAPQGRNRLGEMMSWLAALLAHEAHNLVLALAGRRRVRQQHAHPPECGRRAQPVGNVMTEHLGSHLHKGRARSDRIVIKALGRRRRAPCGSEDRLRPCLLHLPLQIKHLRRCLRQLR